MIAPPVVAPVLPEVVVPAPVVPVELLEEELLEDEDELELLLDDEEEELLDDDELELLLDEDDDELELLLDEDEEDDDELELLLEDDDELVPVVDEEDELLELVPVDEVLVVRRLVVEPELLPAVIAWPVVAPLPLPLVVPGASVPPHAESRAAAQSAVRYELVRANMESPRLLVSVTVDGAAYRGGGVAASTLHGRFVARSSVLDRLSTNVGWSLLGENRRFE